MAGQGRKLWWHGEDDAPEEETPPAPEATRDLEPVGRRIAAYTGNESGADAVEAEAPQAQSGSGPGVSTGEEVDRILRSAQEAAAKLTQAARDEAEQIRADAAAAAARETDEAQRFAEGERERVAQLRAEAEAYAQRTRSEAEAAAEKLRTDSEREAATTIDAACARLENADTEIAERVRASEEQEHERIESLRREANQHEQRLERLLEVCRGMTSQLETLLEQRGADRRTAEPEDESVDEALREETRTEQVP
jgi:vacuolar-type H+-ATPase subunit E/Vma4